MDKYFLYIHLHQAILNILHRAISNTSHRASLNILYRAACEKRICDMYFFFISACTGLPTVLLAPSWRKDSQFVLKFEIRPQEGGETIG